MVGGVRGRGHVRQGASMAGGMCGRRCIWWGACMAEGEACVAGGVYVARGMCGGGTRVAPMSPLWTE